MTAHAQDTARVQSDTPGYVIMLFEPAPVPAGVAGMIPGENFTPPQWAGFAVVIGALFLFEKRARQQR